MTASLLLAATLVAAGLQPTVPPTAEPAPVQTGAAAPAALVLPKGTMIRLMVLNEVNSRDHKAGHRFVLRVDEDVADNGRTLIPTGAKAWGEVVSAEGTGSVGKSGRLNARLLWVDLGGRRIPVTGERSSSGSGGTGTVVAGVVGLGVLGLLMKGNNASLKAGEILNGYTAADEAFETAAPQ